jgi:hypothetical protein
MRARDGGMGREPYTPPLTNTPFSNPSSCCLVALWVRVLLARRKADRWYFSISAYGYVRTVRRQDPGANPATQQEEEVVVCALHRLTRSSTCHACEAAVQALGGALQPRLYLLRLAASAKNRGQERPEERRAMLVALAPYIYMGADGGYLRVQLRPVHEQVHVHVHVHRATHESSAQAMLMTELCIKAHFHATYLGDD